MVQALKAELRKLLTVRSTYFLALIIIVLSGLFTYLGTARTYVEPPRDAAVDTSQTQPPPEGTAKPQEPEIIEPQLTSNLPATKLRENIFTTVMGATLLIAVAVLLLMAHEYRYNTITYALTLSNSRSKVLASKVLVGMAYAIALTLLGILVTIATTYAAVAIKDLNLPAQDISWVSTLSRGLFYTLGFAMMGLAIITLVRNLTAAIVAVFFLPAVDGILSNILVNYELEPEKYLPFSALGRIINEARVEGSAAITQTSVAAAAAVFLLYLAVIWLITWYLFLRRDATAKV